ncbi:uncharacterized protein [Battus philenor]|uniref:uncharacterized protein n=1 Tax=Battus philenor TaxID=42288 RepID=UPI0035CFF392
MMLLVIWTVTALVALTLYMRQLYSRFSRHGVKSFKPVPFFGNIMGILTRREHFSDHIESLYKTFQGERFVGRFEFTQPVIMLTDLDLIKSVTVKDYENFLDHRVAVDSKIDSVFGRNLFSLKGQEWKDMRSTLSPAFTSSKIRLMVPLMIEVGDIMIKSIKTKIKNGGGYIDVDCKDLTTRYANDVIASCAFGLKVDSHTDRSNMFYSTAKKASTFNLWQLFKLFALSAWPTVSKLLRFSLFSKATRHFFWNLVMGTMSEREDKHIFRPDMIQLLMEAKKGQLKHDEKSDLDSNAGFVTVEESSVGRKSTDRVWTDSHLVAQAMLFLIAGFETVSSAMSFAMYELAVNPSVQERLFKEIEEHVVKNKGKFDYSSIQNMKYLDMVISEVLRKWPPVVSFDRLCVRDYNLGKPNNDSSHNYIVRKGEAVITPVWAIHRDPRFYADPEKFDPERFSEQNKHLIKPFTYIPFGLGPRNCIGSRFALCEVKVMLYQLLQHVELSPCEKTCIPAKISPGTFNIGLEGGHWLRLGESDVECLNERSSRECEMAEGPGENVACVSALAWYFSQSMCCAMVMLVVIWLVVLVAAATLFFRKAYFRFSEHGVKTLPPKPFFGNMGGIMIRRQHFTAATANLYNEFPEERFVGWYEFINPIVMLKDIELIKAIGVKDFENFLDHRVVVNENIDPFFGRNLFSLKGQEWKDMRSTLSPAFTSSKIRLMIPFMVEVGDVMIKSLKEKMKNSEAGYIDVDCRDMTTRYANDVIASCAFGLKVDSHSDQNNMFYQMGKVASTFGFAQLLKIIILSSWPTVSKIFRVSLFAQSTKDFFRDLVLNTMNEREARQLIRPDMIHLLMEAKKGKLTHEAKVSHDTDAGFATVEESSVGKTKINRVWSDTDLVAQAVLFFVAGFDTISTAMSFALYELAVHPDVQVRLLQEIKQHDAISGGKLNYDAIQRMTYLDMVVSEVLRKWPPAIGLDRQCLKSYNLGKPNKTSTRDYIVNKGEIVNIPVWPIHRDPNFYPEPEKFDPERFSEQNKHLIKPFTYIPFGVGPRNCIGSRFALCEVKVMLYQLLLHMEVSPCEKTCIPAEIATSTFNIRLKGGDWLRFRSRQ